MATTDAPSGPRCQVWRTRSGDEYRCLNTGIRWVDHACDCSDVECAGIYHLWECQGPCTFGGVPE